ncbi:MAG: hypothetical protein KDC24_06885, partial [Saprospiraceae bacterium]|nr:hypothetical protein [Saprospiraceae bacterium]
LDIATSGAERIQKIEYEQIDTSKKVNWIRTTRLTQNGNGYEQDIVFTVFDSGYYAFDPVKVIYAAGNQLDTAYSGKLLFKVNNPAIDSTGLRDIKPIEEEPRTIEDFYPYLAGLGGLLLLVALYMFIRRLQKGKPEEETQVIPQRPPYELALEKLWVLQKEKPWEKGAVKLYYSDVSMILREFIERQFGFPAMESTTYEIRKRFKGNLWEKLNLDALYQVLETADLVKFAKGTPDENTHLEVLKKSIAFVQEATPADEEE